MAALIQNPAATNRRVPRLSKTFEGKGRTIQSAKDECDVNKLMARYESSGQMPATNPFPPQYGDFSNVDDFHSAQNQVIAAIAAFDELPSKIRTRFGNEPTQLIAFLGDPNNLDEAIELGLAQARTVPTPPVVTETVTPETPKPDENPVSD